MEAESLVLEKLDKNIRENISVGVIQSETKHLFRFVVTLHYGNIEAYSAYVKTIYELITLHQFVYKQVTILFRAKQNTYSDLL
jgi:hypothetical protein